MIFPCRMDLFIRKTIFMYQESLDKIAEEQKEYDLSLQPPASAEQIEDLESATKEELNVELPEAYKVFLKKTNGLNYNGLFIYATEMVEISGMEDEFINGFVDENLLHREVVEDFNDLLIFADGNLDFYVYQISKDEYQTRDRASLDITQKFSSFEELITEALNSHL